MDNEERADDEVHEQILERLRLAWAAGWRASGEAFNEMIGDLIGSEELERAFDNARVLATLRGRGQQPTYVLQGGSEEGGRVCLLCRVKSRRVLVEHVFRIL